ncbi:MAG: hypothetical protein ACM359_02105, partial [Bacillota bacterium]
MMRNPGKYNYIRLVLDEEGTVIPLALESEFVLTPGLKPNVNCFVVPAAVYQALQAAKARTGTLQFWYNDGDDSGDGETPGEPDYQLLRVSVVDVQPVLLEQPPQAAPRIAKYRLCLADRRQAFLPPRGGVLRRGKINPVGSATPYTNVQLILMCLEAMGFALGEGYEIVGDPNTRPQLWDLEWRGNHAPTELAKILDEIDWVCALRSDGFLLLSPRGDATFNATLPAEQVLATLDLPNIDRRGQTVVFTSYPNAVVTTETIYGPSDDTWQFVAEDYFGYQWKPLKELEAVGSFPPEELLRQRFRQVGAGLDAWYMEQFFRFIRLNPATRPYAVFREVMESSGRAKQLVVEAKIAVQDAAGKWANSPNWIPCQVSYLHNPMLGVSSILQVSERLARVEGEGYAGDLLDKIVPLQ